MKARAAARVLGVLLALLCLCASRQAIAEVERFAILIGNNRGDSDEVRLRYAESDAEKMRDVLNDLGGFPPENTIFMQSRSAKEVRQAVIKVNERIRALAPSKEIILLVYYSGHADAKSLHLGGGQLEIAELETIVRGSAADVRMLILDSCRSGALTRVKGGTRQKSFAIHLDDELASQGAIFLTSSSASEDAQESDLLRGSFFTHYLVSGLLGAADSDGDGAVALSEAYQHAYEATLRASSRTLAGTQHPTFRYDLSGKGDVVLTRPGGSTSRATLELPSAQSYLVFADDANGSVVGEVGPLAKRRRLSLKPGRYFVRGRATDYLLEGSIVLDAGELHRLQPSELSRIEYARLVRKGGSDLSMVHGPRIGALGHSKLDNATGPCAGLALGYSVETPSLDLAAQLGLCRAPFRNDYLDGQTDEGVLALRIGHAWDLPIVTAAPYLEIGAVAFHQEFETRGRAPPRSSLAATLAAGLELRVDLWGPVYLELDAALKNYLFAQRDLGLNPSVGLALGTGLGFRL